MKKKSKKSKLKPINFIIKPEIYPFDIMISKDQTDEELIRSIERFGITISDMTGILNLPETIKGKYALLTTNQSIIRLMPIEGGINRLGVIVHECFHATTHILWKAGVTHDIDTSEDAYSYFLEWLVKTVLTELNKRDKTY